MAARHGFLKLRLFDFALASRVGEEVLFRGFLLLGLCRVWGKRTGLAVMALIFSVVHLLVTGASETHWLLFSLLLTLPGVLLGVAYLRSGSLWLPRWQPLSGQGFGYGRARGRARGA